MTTNLIGGYQLVDDHSITAGIDLQVSGRVRAFEDTVTNIRCNRVARFPSNSLVCR